jgi:hypothetical protein
MPGDNTMDLAGIGAREIALFARTWRERGDRRDPVV